MGNTSRKKVVKTFVLDTNVVMHDAKCIYQFGANNVVIPITVLNELDRHKKGNEDKNYQSRQFARYLDKISGDKIFNGGISLGQSKGKLKIELEMTFHKNLVGKFPDQDKPDHKILNLAYCLQRKGEKIILVTKDIYLRTKAKAVGISVEDYRTDRVEISDEFYNGSRTQEGVDEKIIRLLRKDGVITDINPADSPLDANEYAILRNGRQSVLAVFNKAVGELCRVDSRKLYAVRPRNAEQAFAQHAVANPDAQLVTLTGKAGTGKTLLALNGALAQRKSVNQILLARPIITMGKDVGFLKGDINEKMNPWMKPLEDNFTVIKNIFHSADKGEYNKLLKLKNQQKLIIEPLAFIRGRSLSRVILIVDEAQNLTPHEIKTIVTRAGEETKIIFTGDIYQIDNPYLDVQSNGLSYLVKKMQGQEFYAHVNLQKGVRSKLAEAASNLL